MRAVVGAGYYGQGPGKWCRGVISPNRCVRIPLGPVIKYSNRQGRCLFQPLDGTVRRKLWFGPKSHLVDRSFTISWDSRNLFHNNDETRSCGCGEIIINRLGGICFFAQDKTQRTFFPSNFVIGINSYNTFYFLQGGGCLPRRKKLQGRSLLRDGPEF